jgi:hypothetical protein
MEAEEKDLEKEPKETSGRKKGRRHDEELPSIHKLAKTGSSESMGSKHRKHHQHKDASPKHREKSHTTEIQHVRKVKSNGSRHASPAPGRRQDSREHSPEHHNTVLKSRSPKNLAVSDDAIVLSSHHHIPKKDETDSMRGDLEGTLRPTNRTIGRNHPFTHCSHFGFLFLFLYYSYPIPYLFPFLLAISCSYFYFLLPFSIFYFLYHIFYFYFLFSLHF